MIEITYPNGSAPDLIYLGRNRYGKQAGIAVEDRRYAEQDVLRFYPITTRNTVSEACHMEVPAEAVPALVGALEAFLKDGTQGGDP